MKVYKVHGKVSKHETKPLRIEANTEQEAIEKALKEPGIVGVKAVYETKEKPNIVETEKESYSNLKGD